MIFLLLLVEFATSSLPQQNFLDQARLLIYKENIQRLVMFRNNSFYLWNSLINLTSEEEPLTELPSVENLTITDVPEWIPSDYGTILHILKFLKPLNSLPSDEGKELSKVSKNMTNSYTSVKIRSFEERDDPTSMPTMQVEEIQSAMASSNKNKRLYYWKEWRDAMGKKVRKNYERFIRLKNKESRLNGFKDVGHQWRSKYEMECFRQQVDRLWEEIQPLYQQLHAYVRQKLIQKYGTMIKPHGPIPAHLLKYITKEMWPYPESLNSEAREAMRRKNMTAMDMWRLADNFFISLGMNPMTETFWKESVLEKPNDRPIDCYPLAVNFGEKGAHRIRFCPSVTLGDLFVIFHEMGHIHYYLECETQPLLWYRFPNGALQEAIGGVVALSALNPVHLNKIGLLKDLVDDREQDINYLFSEAINTVVALSDMYMKDKWRWDVFDGTIDESNLNAKWWEYKLKIQGHCSFVRRTEENFDAATSYLVLHHLSTMRYFLAMILEVQFHKALCEAKGHVGPLHKCTIHNSTAAGDRLKSMLRLGSSVSWRSAIYNITGGETDRVSAKPLLEFFQPLLDWLIIRNKDTPVGWERNDPTICS